MAEGVLREVELALPMVSGMEIEASNASAEFAESIRMSPDRIDEVRHAVIEAFNNAAEHSRAEDRTVYLTLKILGEEDPEKLCILVKDHGVGFSPEEEERVSANPNPPLRKRHYGLQLIRGMMDDVEIHSGDGGTTVVMSKMR